MTDQAHVFSFEGQAVRVFVVGGDLWFLSTDVLKILGLGQSSIRELPADEKNMHPFQTSTGMQFEGIISESAVFRLLGEAPRKLAEMFESALLTEIIPELLGETPTPTVEAAAVVRPATLDDLRQVDQSGREFWSARDLMPYAGYSRWENFREAIARAKHSLEAANRDPSDWLREATKPIASGKGRIQEVEDFHISRYGCYILFQNGDPRKPEIAALQSYFAVQTRKQELTEQGAEFTIPSSFAEALELAAQQARELDELSGQVKELRPWAEVGQKFVNAEGAFLVADAAKALWRQHRIEIGPIKLFEYMESIGWAFRDRSDGRWRANQVQIQNGRLQQRPGKVFQHPKTGQDVIATPIVMITPKGLARLAQLLNPELAVTK